MSDLLIKGMEMPKEGSWVTLRVFPDGQCFLYSWCGNDFDFMEHLTAVPVPPHGRLIDASEITEHKYTTIPSYRKEYADGKPKSNEEIIAFKFGWNYAIDAIIENAPTIIGTEEDET